MRPSLKQHILKRLVCVVLAVILFAGLFPFKTEAADWKYKNIIITLKQNTYINAKDDYYNPYTGTKTQYLYKISVPANGYVTFQTNDRSASLGVYKSVKKNGPLESALAWTDGKKSNLVLPKGVYYIYAGDDIKIKWKFTKSKNPTNFCMAKAKTLAPKKKTRIVFNHKYEFARWYKIKLPKRKTITLTIKELDRDSDQEFEIFDSQRNKINCPRLTDTSYRTETLQKGTYYLRISNGDYYDSYSGRIWQIMWK